MSDISKLLDESDQGRMQPKNKAGLLPPAPNFYLVRWKDVPWVAQDRIEPELAEFITPESGVRSYLIRRATAADLVNYTPSPI